MAVVGMSWDTAILQSDTKEKQLMGVGWEHREVQCEGDVSGRCFGRNGGLGAALLVSVVDGSYRSWFVALQRRDRGEKGGEGKADEVSLHTEVCCPLCSLQHMAKALELTKKKKKKKKTSTEKTGWKSTSHSVWKQVSQTECASRHLWLVTLWNVSPFNTVFMNNQRWW